jgi:hypothetical protein
MIRQLLCKPKPIVTLVFFRILFGIVALASTLRFIGKGWVEELYQTPTYFFTYYGFDWVKPFDGPWVYAPFVLMILASIGIILGFRFKLASVLYFLSFTYVELLDKTNYLNHYYLFSLLAFLLIFLPANAAFSLDLKFGRVKQRETAPAYFLYIILFQLSCVYFFAGIAKLNSDWLLEAQPMATWLQSHRDMPILGDLFAQKWVAYLFSWIGCFYDLFIVGFLLLKKTRPLAYVAVIGFHILTAVLFPIGVFPYVMIVMTLLFFDSSTHLHLLEKIGYKSTTITSENIQPSSFSKSKIFLISTYVCIQLFLPIRNLLYPGELFWNEEGYRFSWRVMLMHKEGLATFYVQDQATGGEIEIDNTKYLNQRQIEQMSTQPDMILQYAHYLRDQFQDSILVIGDKYYPITNPNVVADVYVALNGRNAMKMIDKSTVLNKEKYNLKHREWLLPYKK